MLSLKRISILCGIEFILSSRSLKVTRNHIFNHVINWNMMLTVNQKAHVTSRFSLWFELFEKSILDFLDSSWSIFFISEN